MTCVLLAPISATCSADARRTPAEVPTPRADRNSMVAHEQLLRKAKQGGIDLYFLGDSITRRWGSSDAQYAPLLKNWTENFYGWNAGNFGWGADRIENVLWRVENGELDGVNPKVIVILAGTNNVGAQGGGDALVEDVARGMAALLRACRSRAPRATIILTAIFPRGDNGGAAMPAINRINARLAGLAECKTIRFLNVNERLADRSGRLFEGMMNPDQLHPSVKGYQVWADALKPLLTELLGPRAATDHAPPPTGDPGVK
jgi:lysophospholipase L1-like esterase